MESTDANAQHDNRIKPNGLVKYFHYGTHSAIALAMLPRINLCSLQLSFGMQTNSSDM